MSVATALRAYRFSANVTLAYLVMNDVSLVKQIDVLYRRYGINVQFFVDGKSSQTSIKELQGLDLSYTVIENALQYVEGMYARVDDEILTPWVLLLMSDEVLSPRALIRVAQVVTDKSHGPVIGLPRRWVRKSPVGGSLEYSTADFMAGDVQWRLLRAGTLTFHEKLHTPGFDVPQGSIFLAPNECIYHFDWVLRSRATRAEKLEKYEALEPGLFDRYCRWYLPEDFPNLHSFVEVDEPRHFRSIDGPSAERSRVRE